MSATELGIGFEASPRAPRAHSISTTPGENGASTYCECGWTAEGSLWSPKEAVRLAHAHLAYPDATLLQLLQGPGEIR